jgi:hypothetical protein
MQQLQAGQTQNALAQYQLGAAQRADEVNTNFLRGVQSAGTDEGAIRQAYMSAGKIKEYQDLLKSQAESANLVLTGKKTQGEINKARKDQFNQMQRDISSFPSDAQINAHLEDILRSEDYSPSEKEVAKSKMQGLLAVPFEQRYAMLASQGATAADLKPGVHAQDTGAGGQLMSTPAFGGAATAIPGSQFTKSMTPFETARIPILQQSADTAASQLKVSQGQLKVAQDRLAREGASLDPAESAAISKAIIDGRIEHSLLLEILTEQAFGTMIRSR